jgi:tetratricopeptide (TPR) repeat protein
MSLTHLSIHPVDYRITISDDFLAGLRQDYAARRIENGTTKLEACLAHMGSFDPTQKNTAAFLGHLAQWVEMGFGSAALLKDMLCGFPKDSETTLPLGDYVHLRMARGLVHMADEEFDEAICCLEIALALENQVGFQELVAISHYWIGKCLRRLYRFDDALRHSIKAEELALRLGYKKLFAVIRILESWLIFKKGKPKEAIRILRESECALLETDDYTILGNIQSAYGRIARREGRYDAALVHTEKAVEEFKRRTPPPYRHLAGSLTNMAFLKQLIALQLQNRMDQRVARRRRNPEPAVYTNKIRKAQERSRISRLREEAQNHLAEAERMYGDANDNRGIGTVHLNRAQVYLDGGELEAAGSEAHKAYQLGLKKNDYLLLARARILESLVENAAFEEQIEDRSDPSQHARQASQLAREACEWAQRTPNGRLLARALIAEGLIFSNDFFKDAEAARQCAERATMFLRTVGHDYLWEDLQALKDRVHHVGSVDSILREWSHGVVGDKTFRQITEEFAGIVIPKVWKIEGYKISRVASRLSVSPKKVRRILSSCGLLDKKNKVVR